MASGRKAPDKSRRIPMLETEAGRQLILDFKDRPSSRYTAWLRIKRMLKLKARFIKKIKQGKPLFQIAS